MISSGALFLAALPLGGALKADYCFCSYSQQQHGGHFIKAFAFKRPQYVGRKYPFQCAFLEKATVQLAFDRHCNLSGEGAPCPSSHPMQVLQDLVTEETTLGQYLRKEFTKESPPYAVWQFTQDDWKHAQVSSSIDEPRLGGWEKCLGESLNSASSEDICNLRILADRILVLAESISKNIPRNRRGGHGYIYRLHSKRDFVVKFTYAPASIEEKLEIHRVLGNARVAPHMYFLKGHVQVMELTKGSVLDATGLSDSELRDALLALVDRIPILNRFSHPDAEDKNMFVSDHDKQFVPGDWDGVRESPGNGDTLSILKIYKKYVADHWSERDSRVVAKLSEMEIQMDELNHVFYLKRRFERIFL